MSHLGGHLSRPRQAVRPPLSTRTLQHPSFMPLYLAADSELQHAHSSQTVHAICPAEVFYTDPSTCCPRRIPNLVRDSEVFHCFQLNTPPPVMSTCLAPPNCPDPFRSGPHPTRELGCPNWKMVPIHSSAQSSRAIVQLTQEEDQAVTLLLRLHHQEPRQNVESPAVYMDAPGAAEPPVDLRSRLFLSPPAEEVHKPVCNDVRYPKKAGLGTLLEQGRWSNVELEAADTLLSSFGLMEDGIWELCHQNPAATPADTPSHHTDLPESTETQEGPEALPPVRAAACTPDGSENEEPVWEDCRRVEDRGASGGFSHVKGRFLSDLEGAAVHVLLSLGDMGPLVNLQ